MKGRHVSQELPKKSEVLIVHFVHLELQNRYFFKISTLFRIISYGDVINMIMINFSKVF